MARAATTDQLIAWLDDAHAMESGLVSILQSHVGHFAAEMPEAARRLELHVADTHQHMQRLKECLHRFDVVPSAVKSTISSVMGSIEGATTTFFRDQLVKDTLADYGAEQFEVACYTALTATATELGFPDIADLCQENLDEDLAMAEWLLQHIPVIVVRATQGVEVRGRGRP